MGDSEGFPLLGYEGRWTNNPVLITDFRTSLQYPKFFVFLQSKTTAMRIISKKTLVKYYTAHPQSKLMLEDWYEKTKKADWKNFADIRATFNTVSSVGNQRYVFNIKGNDYRLVVIIKFHPSHVLIRFVGTHAEYDRIPNITSICYGTNKK